MNHHSGKKQYHGEINIFYPWDLPEKLSGPAVVFDVYAASRNIIDLLGRADELYVATGANALTALAEIPGSILIGETDNPEIEKRFHMASNHPLKVAQCDVTGKKVILLTNNGTHTIHEASQKGALPVIAASYPNLHTAVGFLLDHYSDTKTITLIPAGGREEEYKDDPNVLEDLLCAQAMKKLLEGKIPDFQKDFKILHEYMDKRYIPKPTSEDYRITLTDKDYFPRVPVCRPLSGGIMRVISAPL